MPTTWRRTRENGAAAARSGAPGRARARPPSPALRRRRGCGQSAGRRETHFRRAPGLPPLGTFLVCSAIDAVRCLGGRLRVVQADGEAGGGRSLGDAIGALVEEALEARAMRKAAGAGGEAASLLLGRVPVAQREPVRENDMKGLVGEIVAEAVLVECGFGVPFYSKWRHTGTSASNGIDIVMRKGGLLLACESKHLHALRPGGGARRAVSAAIAAALQQSADRHVKRWLSWLRRECVAAAGLGGAGAMLRKARIIDEALSAWSVSACAIAVLDARHVVDAGSVGLRLGPGALGGMAGSASVVVSRIVGLREATALLIGRHC